MSILLNPAAFFIRNIQARLFLLINNINKVIVEIKMLTDVGTAAKIKTQGTTLLIAKAELHCAMYLSLKPISQSPLVKSIISNGMPTKIRGRSKLSPNQIRNNFLFDLWRFQRRIRTEKTGNVNMINVKKIPISPHLFKKFPKSLSIFL